MANGNTGSNFDFDLRYGNEREMAFIGAIGDCHFECKSDRMAKETGRIFVETHSRIRNSERWQESGISVSTAGWWVIEVCEDRWVIVRRTHLKQLARLAEEKLGGDEDSLGKRFRGRLIPIQWLIQPVKIQRIP